MKVITIKSWEAFNAGPKALEDVQEILAKHDQAKPCVIDLKTGKIRSKGKLAWNLLLSHFSKEILVLQYPIFERKELLNLANKKRTILFVHDIEGLRSQNEELLKQEIERFQLFQYIVVHNQKMKQFLIEKRIPEEKLYLLELFDYLCQGEEKNRQRTPVISKKDIKLCYAGNLRQEKSPFLYQITEEMLGFDFYLYGVGAETEKLTKRIHYEGKADPAELPNQLKGNLGLVWDGLFDESDEKEKFKGYTKYNNPHKLSCYLAAGIPVVVWEKAAIADFVKKQNIGYTIRNFAEMEQLDFSDYEQKYQNVQELKQRVRNGYYTIRIIEEIKEKMEEEQA